MRNFLRSFLEFLFLFLSCSLLPDSQAGLFLVLRSVLCSCSCFASCIYEHIYVVKRKKQRQLSFPLLFPFFPSKHFFFLVPFTACGEDAYPLYFYYLVLLFCSFCLFTYCVMVVHQFFSDFKCLPFRCKVKALASLFFLAFFSLL